MMSATLSSGLSEPFIHALERCSRMRNIFVNTFPAARATRLMTGAALLGVTAGILMISATPVLAVGCEDVRALTKVQQNYWAKRLNLTSEQRERIRLECYGQPRIREAKGDRPQPVSDRAER
jgi:Spy/CpxP family protein refolding chaperone